jgi:hypothetical protein
MKTFTVKVKNFVFTNGHTVPPSMLTIELRMVIIL